MSDNIFLTRKPHRRLDESCNQSLKSDFEHLGHSWRLPNAMTKPFSIFLFQSEAHILSFDTNFDKMKANFGSIMLYGVNDLLTKIELLLTRYVIYSKVDYE